MRSADFFETHPVFRHEEFLEAHTSGGRSAMTSNNLLAKHLSTGRLLRVRRGPEQVRRNAERFPRDFMFQLTRQEAADLKSQIATSSEALIQSRVAADSGHGGRRKLPFAFTEHGAIMAANVLNSPEAIRMSVFVVRAFVTMREALISRFELERRLLRIENFLVAHDESIRELYDQIRPLLLPAPEPPRKKIGFEAKEAAAPYGKGKIRGMRKQICDGNL